MRGEEEERGRGVRRGGGREVKEGEGERITFQNSWKMKETLQ